MIGTSLGPYKIIEQIGAGGMGEVYLGEDTRLGRKVAIKVLPTRFASDPERLARFDREARAAAALNHPHIAVVHDIGTDGNTHFIVEEHLEGETLRQALREGAIPVGTALALGCEIAEALSAAHSAGIVHRDVKPENVVVTPDGHAKVLDFGLAKVLEVEASSDEDFTHSPTVAIGGTRAGVLLGTAAYMSPEQVRGMPLDQRTDVWAFGCLLFEMLVGRQVFEAATNSDTMAAILKEEPDWSLISSATPKAVVSLLRGALEKDAARRTGDIEVLRKNLSDVLSTESGLSTKRVALILAGTTGLAALVLAVWLMRSDFASGQLGELVAELNVLADERSFEVALRVAEDRLPRDAEFTQTWERFSREIHLFATEPPGASIARRAYNEPAGPWEELGTSPLRSTRVPRGLSVYRIALPGHKTLELAQQPGWLEARTLALPPEETVDDDMVWVAAGDASIPNYSWATVEVGEYLLDRHEVTNREFKEFVAAGGYSDQQYWEPPFLLDGATLSWAEAMEHFVDRTGRPGPSTWEAGSYSGGRDGFPVQGVSWYEARAYARFHNKDLPTVFHWYRAARVSDASYVAPMSNFGGEGPAVVGEHRAVTSWGALDMAGNVREWAQNGTGVDRFTLGGAWDDFRYMFVLAYAASPWDRSEKNGFRLAKYLGNQGLEAASRSVDLGYRDYRAEHPVSDETFEAFKVIYDYDPQPLNAKSSTPVIADDWTVQRVSFDAAYGQDRVIVDVYLPTVGSPPYHAIVFMPGSGAISTARCLDDVRGDPLFDFILQSGRAVILPAYDGAYDRRRPDVITSRASETHAHAEITEHWVKDLRRTVDYLEGLASIDSDKIGYLGNSWGGRVGGIMLALEPRLKVGVLYHGGFRPERALPIADDLNFVPRVTVPVLMINGRDDHLRPLEASQIPFFQSLGTEPPNKRHAVFEGGHFVSRANLIRETLDWLDAHLGPIDRD